MDRASDSGSEGWGFESLPVYQKRIIRILSPWEKDSGYLFICPNFPDDKNQNGEDNPTFMIFIKLALRHSKTDVE